MPASKPVLKLFVWHDVLRDYGAGIAFALATSVREARELVCADLDPEFGEEIRTTMPRIYTKPAGFRRWGSA